LSYGDYPENFSVMVYWSSSRCEGLSRYYLQQGKVWFLEKNGQKDVESVKKIRSPLINEGDKLFGKIGFF
jgi:hypothetical protein